MSKKPKAATPRRIVPTFGFVRRLELPVVFGGLAIVAALYGLFAMWRLAELTSPYGLDTRILLGFRVAGDLSNPIGSVRFEGMVRDATALGSTLVLTLLTSLAVIFLAMKRRWWAALMVLATIGGGQIVSTLLKAVFDRPRPTLVPHLVVETSNSFPSGHAMMSMVAYMTFAALLRGTVIERRLRMFFFAVALLLTLAVGTSRIYLGVHWPSDVLAGWCAGIAWMMASWLVSRWWSKGGADPH